MNANREIFLLAYSIVDSKNAASWTWFMTLLATHIFPNHEPRCIISNRHAGIDAAFRDLSALHPPRVQRRYCLRHIRSNVMTRNRNRRLRALIWEAGTATTRGEFGNKMERIRAEWPAAYNYLATFDAEKWALSHDGGHRYGIMTTNSSESFNNSLKGCRMLLVTALARLTFHKIRVMFADRRTAGQRMREAGLCWPKKVFDELAQREQQASNATIERYNDSTGLYGVALERRHATQRPLRFHKVCLNNSSCDCGKWNANTSLPCAHIIAARHFKKVTYDSFVPNVFSMEHYMASYVADFFPPCNEIQWRSERILLPPSSARRNSRPGQRRTRRFQNEMDFGNTTATQRCNYCRARTHVSNQCPTLNYHS
ncbi:uncharacterized protein LOC116001182 [Ipomoea triloba]|uniref:uncharacterized protein LOC116001182 n=1 Tax=Ipomoea triloba TaxID=35885 RepID=UPI00125D6E33|nr:uncharacterized protein LOC116001182 [Ipomoea triloba]